MIELGRMQELEISRLTKFGAFLITPGGSARQEVLLPGQQVPEKADLGDLIEVFVYKDSEDRLIATTKMPKLTLGELAVLEVVDTSRVGAFLDWGLEKDLLLPFKEQSREVRKNEKYLVGLYIDKSDRLCATMDISRMLLDDSPYKENEMVSGTIYRINKDIGAYVAVANKYNGLIFNKELYGTYKVGDQVEVRIKKVREDGKLELSLRKQAHHQIEDDAQVIFDKLRENHGKLPYNDKSQPEEISKVFHMSKAAFKRAVGKLLKERKIAITDEGIEMV